MKTPAPPPPDLETAGKRLIAAAEDGQLDEVKKILPLYKNAPLPPKALEGAIRGGRMNVVRCLLSKGKYHRSHLRQFLETAASYHRPEILGYLIVKTNPDADTMNAALSTGVMLGADREVVILLAAGADPDPANGNAYAFRHAVQKGHDGMVDAMLDHIFRPDRWQGKSVAELNAKVLRLIELLDRHKRISGDDIHPVQMEKTIAAIRAYAFLPFQAMRGKDVRARPIRPHAAKPPRLL